ncbi:RpiB/LacA/LacB family sugar-phosphate isomerase [Blattabacterium cuenoti]|uniref:RpiB/LacA/LacB family sugar-phosphate isomerase n=1 Tax=Blattabacterium cuenoti TaxID=1653831 RepID=UPI00163BFE6E|nr:RpiB/LacA/LacB family sugar-phosphate isomerase [Blattabacterium cuenoti]
MVIAIGSDHTGLFYKGLIIDFLIKKGHEVKDFGYSGYNSEKVDYPDFVHPTAKFVEEGKANFGIVLCGSGNGAAMTANKYNKIRAALVWKKEIASLARRHNDANIISLPTRFISKVDLLEIIEVFINTNFDAGRHQIRIEKISLK